MTVAHNVLVWQGAWHVAVVVVVVVLACVLLTASASLMGPAETG